MSEVDLLRALLASFCLTPGVLFCGYSHLWESYPLLAPSLGLLRDAVSTGLIIPASGYGSSAEFLATRQERYAHDASRYPLYFNPKKSKEIQNIQPGFSTSSSATESLEQNLSSLITSTAEKTVSVTDTARRILEAGLKNRENKAITGSLFEAHSDGDTGSMSFIRRTISKDYTQHYMAECSADILTSVPRLGLFDELAVSFPLYDYVLFNLVLGICYGVPQSPDELRRLIQRAIEHHGDPEHTAFLMQFERLLTASLHTVGMENRSSGGRAPTMGKIVGDLKRRAYSAGASRTARFSFEEFGSVLLRLEKIDQGHGATTPILNAAGDANAQKNIVFILATDSEWKAAQNIFKKHGFELQAMSTPKVAAWSAGEINGYHLVVVRTEMGTQNAGAATLVTSDAIEVFRPAYAVMPGIAFGLKQDKQKMCDVLVASSVVDYETAKVMPGTVDSRGANYPSSPELFAKAREAGAARTNVHYGEIICGCKVVNDPTFRDSLVSRYPKAIGGEMEGIGLAAACHRENVPWILAKAICDWGEIKNDDHHSEAATKSIGFCIELVKLLPLGYLFLAFMTIYEGHINSLV
jgi:nucleoside phosphorylase